MFAIAFRVFPDANSGQTFYSDRYTVLRLYLEKSGKSGIIRFPKDGQSVQMNKAAAKERNPLTRAPGSIPTSDSADSATRWTFLTNHAHVLAVLYSDPQIVLRQVAIAVGITERAVQRIVQDLEEGGFIQREKVGRQNRVR